ncbi:MAG TPA: OmpA family protein [Leptospiraceae bacterium]|nr:OmpA family protein [Leptospiraceae bacterium]HRG75780.1 OmpA family protein [Leptospiraceae bacterium]
MNQKYIRSLLYGLVFLIISHDLTIAQETTTEKVPADPKQKEALFFYWKSELKDLTEQKKALDLKYAELETKYTTDTEALKAENEKLKKYNTELEADKKDRVAARDVVSKTSDDRIAALEKELATTKKQKEQVEKDLQAKTFAEKQAQDKIKELESTIAALRAEKNATEKNTVSSTVVPTPSVSRSTDVAANASNAELQAQVNSLTNQRDQLQKDLAATYSHIESLKKNQPVTNSTTSTSTTTTSSSLTSDNSTAVTPASTSAETKLQDSEAKVKSLEAKLSDVITERDKLQKELAVAKAAPVVVPSEPVKTVATEEKTDAAKSTPATDHDKKIADLQAQVNSLTNQRDQLQRDIAAIYGYQRPTTIGEPVNPYTTIENKTEPTPAKVAPATTNGTTTTVIASNASLEEALARAKKLEADLAEMTKQRDKLQKELDTNYNNMYTSKTNPLSPTTTPAANTTQPAKETSTTTTTATTTTETAAAKNTDATPAVGPAKTTTETTPNAAKTTDVTPVNGAAKTATETTVTTTTETTVESVLSPEASKARIKQLETELATLTKERDQLKRDLNASKADKTLETKIIEITTKIEKIESDKTLTQEEKAAQIKAANEEIEKINKERATTTTSIDKNVKEIDKKNVAMDELKKEYESKIEALNKEITELKEDKETLETDLASSKEQLEEETSKHKEDVERLTLQAQKLEEALEKEIKKGGKSNAISNGSAKITSKGGKTIVSLASTVNFKSGSRELTTEGKRTLDNIIKVLKKHSSERIQVEGNTDSKPLPTSSKLKDNWHLSFERALTVLKYLNKGSLGKTQFVAAGLSDKNPVKPNTSEANRAANRRVDIVVMPKR